MKRIQLIICFFLFVVSIASSQNCLPGGITFSTQEEIDNFINDYPDVQQ